MCLDKAVLGQRGGGMHNGCLTAVAFNASVYLRGGGEVQCNLLQRMILLVPNLTTEWECHLGVHNDRCDPWSHEGRPQAAAVEDATCPGGGQWHSWSRGTAAAGTAWAGAFSGRFVVLMVGLVRIISSLHRAAVYAFPPVMPLGTQVHLLGTQVQGAPDMTAALSNVFPCSPEEGTTEGVHHLSSSDSSLLLHLCSSGYCCNRKTNFY